MDDSERKLASAYAGLGHIGFQDGHIAFSEEQMFDDLSPFFTDHELLKKIVEQRTHIWEYAVFLSIKDDADLSSGFHEIFDIYKSCSQNKERLRRIARHHFRSVRTALENAHDSFYLERRKDSFLDRVQVKSAFQELDILLEGSVLPLLRLIASLYGGKIKEYDSHSFGQVVSILESNTRLRSILAPSPWNVRLSQWRNISSHKSYALDTNGESIVCTYGKYRQQTVVIPCSEMEYFLIRLNAIFHVIKSAIMFVEADYIWAIRDLLRSVDVSIDTITDTFAQYLISHGINIIKFTTVDSSWAIEGIDTLFRDGNTVEDILTSAGRFFSTLDVVVNFRIQVSPFGHILKGKMGTNPKIL